MTHHLPLSTSIKLVELIGEFHTENYWTCKAFDGIDCDPHVVPGDCAPPVNDFVPAPTMNELLLLLPRIKEAKGWEIEASTKFSKSLYCTDICIYYESYMVQGIVEILAREYIESNGDMKKVAEVLEEIIK